MLQVISRVHNKRREGEYPTLTIPCTNALRKVPSVNHRVLLFCINTLRETKGALISVNRVVLGIVDMVDIDINIVNVSTLTTGRAAMNFMPGHSGISNPRHLLDQAEMRAEKFLPVRERAIVNAQSLDGAGILFAIVRPASQSLLTGHGTGFSALTSTCNFLFGGGSSQGSSQDDSKISEFHNIEHLIESISKNSAYYW